MYLTAEHSFLTSPTATEDPIERELRDIEDLRLRALGSRDLLYASPTVRHLVEREVPRLMDLVRRIRDASNGSGKTPSSEAWVWRLLEELREEVRSARDLLEPG